MYDYYEKKVLLEGAPARSRTGRAFQSAAYFPELIESADVVREILSVDKVEKCAVFGAALFLCTNRAPLLHAQNDASDAVDARVLEQILIYGELEENEIRLLLTQCLEGGKPHCARTLLSRFEVMVGRDDVHTQARNYFVGFLSNKKVAVVFDEYGFGDMLTSRTALMVGCYATSISVSKQLHCVRNTNPPLDTNGFLLEYVLHKFRETGTPIPQQYMRECMDFLVKSMAIQDNIVAQQRCIQMLLDHGAVDPREEEAATQKIRRQSSCICC